MDRLYFIVNPVAGSGKCGKNFTRILELLRERGAAFAYAMTEFRNHAVELTRAALAAGEKNIIAVGGDGTVNEVASVLVGTDATMGVLPFGTGNDFAHAAGIPTEVEAALDVVMNGNARRIDAGMANDRFFINIAGFGFDVDVLVNTERYKKRFNGMLPYLLGLIRALKNLKTFHLTIDEGDGKEKYEVDSHIISIGNGRYFGGGMMALPKAELDDGVFDVCYAKKMTKGKYLKLLPKYIKGKHIGIDEICYFHAKNMTIESDIESVIDIDGELVSKTPLSIKMLPGAINMLLPARQTA